jgi:hypothetical protein
MTLRKIWQKQCSVFLSSSVYEMLSVNLIYWIDGNVSGISLFFLTVSWSITALLLLKLDPPGSF